MVTLMSSCHSFYWKPISPYLIHPNLSNGSICSSVYCLYVYLNNFVCVKERVRDDRERERVRDREIVRERDRERERN